jgi:hypothetical protein
MTTARVFLARWLMSAHSSFPLPLKFVLRGVIAGSGLGFVLSLGYSMLFGLPFALVVFVALLTDLKSQGIVAIGNGLLAVAFIVSALIVQFGLPATVIGSVGGAITGAGVRLASQAINNSPFRAILLSTIFWILPASIAADVLLPELLLRGYRTDFERWAVAGVPSALFVGAMACVARRVLIPFVKPPVGV